jgi:glycosyltransferase involved in cell wall biosynthesis
LEKIKQPIVTVGIPTFNSEKNLPKTIESVLNQTFRDFELIISDNASTDSTSTICMEYAKKDHRIKYIKQEKNIHALPNFCFLGNSAITKYFVWLASDDYWEPTFLEKNIEILESHQNLVGSISEIDFYGKYAHRYQTGGKFLKHSIVKPFSGSYPEKIKLLLKSFSSMMYGLYKTEELQKALPTNPHWWHEYEFLIPLLKHGDFYVIDDVLMHRGADGMSSSSQIRVMRSLGISITGIIFMNWPVIRWSLNNLGLKFILKNLHLYLRLMYLSYGRLVLDLLRSIRKKLT